MIVGYRKDGLAGMWRIVEVSQQILPGYKWTATFDADNKADDTNNMALGFVASERAHIVDHLREHGFAPIHDTPEPQTRYRIEVVAMSDIAEQIRDMMWQQPFDFWVTSVEGCHRVYNAWHMRVDVAPYENSRDDVVKAAQYLADMWPGADVTLHSWTETVQEFSTDNPVDRP